MVEKKVEKKPRTKKTSPSEKSGDDKKEMKASTGAWWKSAVPDAPDEQGVPDAPTVPEAGLTDGQTEPEPARPKRPARKRAAQKKAPQEEAGDAGAGETGEQETESPVPVPEKKPRRRPPRKRAMKKTDLAPPEDSEGVPAVAAQPVKADESPENAPQDEAPAAGPEAVAAAGGGRERPESRQRTELKESLPPLLLPRVSKNAKAVDPAGGEEERKARRPRSRPRQRMRPIRSRMRWRS